MSGTIGSVGNSLIPYYSARGADASRRVNMYIQNREWKGKGVKDKCYESDSLNANIDLMGC